MKKKISTYKAHEARMWLQNIIIPAAVFTAGVATNPEARNWVGRTYRNTKLKVKTFFAKHRK